MSDLTKKILNDLFEGKKNNNLFYKNIINLQNFRCIYDKSIFEEFKSQIMNKKLDNLLKGKEFLEIYRNLKRFMKKKEMREIKEELYAILGNLLLRFLNVMYSPNRTKINKINGFFQNIMRLNEKELKSELSKFKYDIKTMILISLGCSFYEEAKTFYKDVLPLLEKLVSFSIIDLNDQKQIKVDITKKINAISAYDKFLIDILRANETTREDEKNNQLMIQHIYSAISQSNLNNYLKSPLEIMCFGSFVNGFSLRFSDVDCTLLTNCYVEERLFLSTINGILDQLRTKGFEILTLNMKTIRIPIIKIKHPDLGDMDLAINNVLGVANSKLLTTYSKITEKCSKLGKLIKFWGKNFHIIGPTVLSSYATTLLLIYFLQIKKILPSLQSMKKIKRRLDGSQPAILKIKRKGKNLELEEFDTIIDFETNEQEIRKYMDDHNYGENKQTIYELLVEFFKFYSKNGIFLACNLRCNIRKGKFDIKRKGEENFLYSIVDPFDHRHNPGNKIKIKSGESEKTLGVIEYTISSLETGKIFEAFNIKS